MWPCRMRLFLLEGSGYLPLCRSPWIARGMMNSVMIQSEVKCIKSRRCENAVEGAKTTSTDLN